MKTLLKTTLVIAALMGASAVQANGLGDLLQDAAEAKAQEKIAPAVNAKAEAEAKVLEAKAKVDAAKAEAEAKVAEAKAKAEAAKKKAKDDAKSKLMDALKF